MKHNIIQEIFFSLKDWLAASGHSSNFINPSNGDVMICDNDNVMANNERSGILGKARYMAPEIVAGGIPDKYSDRFSLSVILFMLFYL